LAGLITLGTLIRLPQLGHGLNEFYVWRETHSAYVALEYARHGINLMHSPMPIYGPNADVPWEFPLVQAAAAILIRLGVGADSAMRIIGLVGFQAAAILLAVLVFRWHGQLVAVVGMALFQFTPFALAWGASPLIDFPSVALALGMVVGLDAWFRTGSRIGLLLGAVSGWLAFLVKATTPSPWCVLVLVSAATAYLGVRSLGRITAGFLAGPIIGAAAGAAWGRYAEAIRGRNPLTVAIVPKDLDDWIFGTLNERLDARAYTPILARIGMEIAGPLWLGLVLAVVGIMLAPTKVERVRRAGWLATAVSAPLVFLTLFHIHEYYLIGIFPAIVAAVGVGIVAIAERIRAGATVVAAVLTVFVVATSAPLAFFSLYHMRGDYLAGIVPAIAIVAAVGVGIVAVAQRKRIRAGTTIVAAATTVCVVAADYNLAMKGRSYTRSSWNVTIPIILWNKGIPNVRFQESLWLYGENDIRQWVVSPPPDPAGERIRAMTRPDDLIVLVGCVGPQTLYFADRRGVMLPDNNLDVWKRENINDYRYVFTCHPEEPVTTYLPAGYEVIPTSAPGLWRIAPKPAS
jgi:hypothetical protein